ncbi:MAG: tetratricopeptide repeat protein [Gammaproteobacteria bacterium]|nr:tetratricopeptide repeat protein [Gammaproteobacteria bacterium]MYH14970.1 tetratricopeptide repeat protein [Gammaproteobacteria bacterium]MYK29141.1 tetratricopeptide repeat protein [Gammaproteobacteria bacterium]MYK84288.1 tetratricopeptide repeat protein [Gammaproteobacteria bacterium]
MAIEKVRVVNVPHELKIPVLKWLRRQNPPVSHSTMYEDMPGYARSSAMYEDALLQYHNGFRQADDSVSALKRACTGQEVMEALAGVRDAAEKMHALATREPGFTWAHWRLGKMYMVLRQFDDVIRAYEEALEWCTDHDPSAEETVTILVDLGVAYQLIGSVQGAESAFEQARTKGPTLADKLIRSHMNV